MMNPSEVGKNQPFGEKTKGFALFALKLAQYFGHRSFDCANKKDLENLKLTETWKLLKG